MKSKLTILAALLLLGSVTTAIAAQNEVNVFSYRETSLIKPVLDDFSKETGIKVNLLFSDKGLIERIAMEGKNSKADLFLTADIGNLWRFKDEGLAAKIPAEILSGWPAELIGGDNLWVALTLRARLIFAKKGASSSQYMDYTALAEPEWKGKICIRSGKHPYNIGLISYMIGQYGEDASRTWLQGLKGNLARRPQGNDRAQSQAIYNGVCDLAIMNTYYYGLMANNTKEPQQKLWAEAITPLLPTQDGPGANINASGVALSKYAKNQANALKLIAFLLDTKAQQKYAELNYEFPASPAVKSSSFLDQNFKGLKLNLKSLKTVPENLKQASDLVDEVRFDL